MRRDLPSGTVTFMFTDIDSSTKLLHQLGADAYGKAVAGHRRVLRKAFARHGGVEVDTQGDAFFVAFPTAPGAVAAAREAQAVLISGPIKVRMGLHTGTPNLGEEGYVGVDVHRAARIAAAGHGGQVLVSASTAALVGTDGLRDLGEHRLKDLSAPEGIYQLGEAAFPPLKSLHQTNLPIPATPFLGRERELAEVGALLRRKDVRLLTLTGPGGTGKTRLALQSAGAAADAFEGGVWWVPLAPLRDPGLVLAAARQSLGAKYDLAQHIGDRSMLLLFDNFEQVVEAAPDVAALIDRCRRLTVLVTSRESLRLEGEWEYSVDPLREAEAVELFTTRALAARRDFAANGEVREICARLDNLPLAIELAAARIKVLSPRALLERLEQRLPLLAGGTRDAPERQRTLRATIAWSNDLLSPDEQALFRRLAVFRGGCTVEAAEVVCDADLDGLGSLVDKSLLRQRDDRFSMLDTIREYAAERLEESGEAEELRRRHAEHFLALAEEAEPSLFAESLEWANRLEREHDNLRAALDRFGASGDTQLALRLGGTASLFWLMKSHLPEGQRRLESALLADERPTAARAKALLGAAVIALNLADAAPAEIRAQEALALYRALDDARGGALAALAVASSVANQGDLARAQPLLAESLRVLHESGDEHYAMMARSDLAWVTGELGDRDAERALSEQNLQLARELDDVWVEAESLAQLGVMACDDGRLEDAASMLRAALRIGHDHDSPLGVAETLSRLASVLARAGRAEVAMRLVSSSEALIQGLVPKVPWWAARRNEETRKIIRDQLDEAAVVEASEQGRQLTADEAVALALESAD